MTDFVTDVPTCENGVIYKMLVVYIPTENDTEESGNREEHYLATFDLNASDHLWHFVKTARLPEGLYLDEMYYALTPAVYNGKFLCIGDPGTIGSTDSTLPVYSYDPAADEWTQEPSLPYISECFDIVRSNGRLYVMFGFDPDRTKSNEERILSSVWCFDGEKWEQKRSDLKYVGRINDNDGTLFHSDPITPAKNGLIFTGASVDGGGNMFLYNTDTDEIEPLYYTAFDSVCDARNGDHSCVAARDGVYYLYHFKERNEQYSGWKLCLLPVGSGAYESPFEDRILGGADGDGRITVMDVTAIQKHIASVSLPEFDETAADVDGDGKVTISDATELQRYLADLPCDERIGEPIGEKPSSDTEHKLVKSVKKYRRSFETGEWEHVQTIDLEYENNYPKQIKTTDHLDYDDDITGTTLFDYTFDGELPSACEINSSDGELTTKVEYTLGRVYNVKNIYGSSGGYDRIYYQYANNDSYFR